MLIIHDYFTSNASIDYGCYNCVDFADKYERIDINYLFSIYVILQAQIIQRNVERTEGHG